MGDLHRGSIVKGNAMNRAWFNSVAAGFLAMVNAGPVGALMIDSPAPAQLVVPGQTFWLSVQPTSAAEVNVQRISVIAPGASGCQDLSPALPAQCALTVSEGSDGSQVPAAIDIRVYVALEDGTQANASTHVSVAPTKSLVALEGEPRKYPVTFDALNQAKRVKVVGLYADGSRRDTALASQGTTYEVVEIGIVEVQDGGRIVAKGEGATTVIVRNGSVALEIPVLVRVSARATR